MSENALHRLHAEQDQSPWIDFIDRELISSGRLEQFVADGIRGLTSNPTIFAKAVATGQYDDLIRREIGAGDDARGIYQAIAVADVGDASDVLRRVYDDAEGTDGFASIEVEPDLADDSDATLARARELWGLWIGRTSSSRSRRPRRAFPPSRPPSPMASTSTSP